MTTQPATLADDYCGCCGGIASAPPKGEHDDCCRQFHDAPAAAPAAPMWRDYFDITPAQYAALFAAAAARIAAAGYTPFDDYEGETGISIRAALFQAVQAAPGRIDGWMIDGGAGEVAEHAEAKLVSLLLLTGQISSDLGVGGWERGLNRRGTASAADVAQLLAAAQAVMAALPGA